MRFLVLELLNLERWCNEHPVWATVAFAAALALITTMGCGGGEGDPLAPPGPQAQQPVEPSPPGPSVTNPPPPGQPTPPAPSQPPAPAPAGPPPPPAPGPEPPAPPPPRQLRTLVFDGTYAFGQVTGDWTYDLDAAPIATNQGNLMNRIYRPESWNFETTSTDPTFLPAMTFTTGNSTGEWCIGLCKLGGEAMAVLRLRRDGYLLEIAFTLLAQHLTLPEFAEIGDFRQSLYKKEPFVPVALIEPGRLSTPELETAALEAQ